MKGNSIEKLNGFLRSCQEYGEKYKLLIGKGLSNLDLDFVKKITSEIPVILESLFPNNKYKIKGSVGQGRITECPWVAIMNKEETESTQNGIYLVFLFSRDLKNIYFNLAQGVTNSSLEILENTTELIRNKLKVESSLLNQNIKLNISNKKYQKSVIYSSEWPIYDFEQCEKIIEDFRKVYELYMQLKNGLDIETSNNRKRNNNDIMTDFSINTIVKFIKETGLLYTDSLIKRFAFSLMAKRFLILSGLAGSGKTQLALAFAKALIQDKSQLCVVCVGADWTNREPLLGFPNALQEGKYVKPESGVLDLLIEANKEENQNKPYFLVLDEMNMSYVERYFADFLSVMESGEGISLWNRDEDVPATISLPKNLFIIGTINVDETTYMFSPKVLDRANVIEFKISTTEMDFFLNEMKDVDRDGISGKAAGMGASFVELASNKELEKDKDVVRALNDFFNELKKVNAEFGYRTATEIFRYIAQAKKNDDSEEKLTNDEILDSAIIQKLLPKLHGSRKKLEPVLMQLWKLCFDEDLRSTVQIAPEEIGKAKYKDSADKIFRMYESANANGFTSFAEA